MSAFLVKTRVTRMAGGTAAIPNELVGLLLNKAGDKKDAIPHALRLACVSYMRIERGTLPTFSLNERHCRKAYGIKRESFQIGMRLLRQLGIITSRTQTGPRRLSVDLHRRFGPNFVPVNEVLLTERPNVLALFVLVRMRMEPSVRDKVCREIGVTSANTQKKLVKRLLALGLIEAHGIGSNTHLIACDRTRQRALLVEKGASRKQAFKNQAVKKPATEAVKKSATQVTSQSTNPTSPFHHGHDHNNSFSGLPDAAADAACATASAPSQEFEERSGLPSSMYVALHAIAVELLASAPARRLVIESETLLSRHGLEQLGPLIVTPASKRHLENLIKRTPRGTRISNWHDILNFEEKKLIPDFTDPRVPASCMALHYLDTANMSKRLPSNLRHDHEGLVNFLNEHGRLPMGARDLLGEPTFEEALAAMRIELQATPKSRVNRWHHFEPCLAELRNRPPTLPPPDGYATWRMEAEQDHTTREGIEWALLVIKDKAFSTLRAYGRTRTRAGDEQQGAEVSITEATE